MAAASTTSATLNKAHLQKDRQIDMFTENPITKVCCVGAGYVGGPTMAVFAEHIPGITFTVVDIDQRRIDAWNSPSLPIYEPGLAALIERVRGKNLFFSTNVEEEIKAAQVVFISVNTGTKEFGFGAGSAYDLCSIEIVARTIARCATSRKIVVEKSTVPVNTADRVRTILDANANKNPDGSQVRCEVLSNPEFLAEGMAIQNLETPDRVLVGSSPSTDGTRAAEQLCQLYRRWVPADRVITSNVYSSELAKLAANAMLAQRISSINAFSAICEATGANIDEVSLVLGTDQRIGNRFLKSSVGWGGSCFRKDLLGLIYLCECLRLEEVAAYWRQVLSMNEYQKDRFVKAILSRMFGTIRNKKIAVLGYAFKKDTSDSRDSPAIHIVGKLLEEKARVHLYDPRVPHEDITRDFPDVVCYTDAYACCDGAAAIVVLTEWDEFQTLDYARIYQSMPRPAFIFDGRNILDHSYLSQLGFTVHAIGKLLSFSL